MDGKTEKTAAESCVSIKMDYPSSQDGLYWITAMGSTKPFNAYCDMERGGFVRAMTTLLCPGAGCNCNLGFANGKSDPAYFNDCSKYSDETLNKIAGSQKNILHKNEWP